MAGIRGRVREHPDRDHPFRILRFLVLIFFAA